jgi:hypothetical protein
MPCPSRRLPVGVSTVSIAFLVAVLGRQSARAEDALVLDGQFGPALLTKSRSRAIGHGFKPVARLGLRFPAGRQLELGGALSGVVDASEHYRVLGVVAHARLALWRRPAFSFGAGVAFGAGYNADILHAALRADAPLIPYGFLALDARWSLGERWLVGVEGGWENLSIARLGLLFGFQFHNLW